MNSGPTAERVYHALKAQIMGRHFRPGERLEPTLLAERLSSSVTPVRDALHLLTGEGLVRTRTGDGFHLPSIHEARLGDLYAWTCEALTVAIRAWPAMAAAPASLARAEGVAERTGILFAGIASLSPYAEHEAALSSLNARLHSVRLLEPQVLLDTEAEDEALEGALSAVDRRLVTRLVAAYHRRRRRHAAEIVRAAYRTAPAT